MIKEFLRTISRARRRRLPALNDVSSTYARRDDASVHATAVVSDDAELAPGVVIGPFAVVEGQTRIGAGCQIGAHSVIKRFTSMGIRNRVYEHSVLGGEPQDVGFTGEEGRLLIGDENLIREGVSIHRARDRGEATILGSRNYVMANVHIGHDCKIGDRVGIASNSGLSGHVRVDDDAYISGHVGIVGRCRIGRSAMVGGMSKLAQDVLPFCIADGVPAVLVGLHMKALRSAGVEEDRLRHLKLAYSLLSARGPALDDSLAKLSTLDDPLIAELIAFVRSSTRGFCRARRARPRLS